MFFFNHQKLYAHKLFVIFIVLNSSKFCVYLMHFVITLTKHFPVFF